MEQVSDSRGWTLEMTLRLNVPWIRGSIDCSNVTGDPILEELPFEECNWSIGEHIRLFYSVKFFGSAGFNSYDLIYPI